MKLSEEPCPLYKMERKVWMLVLDSGCLQEYAIPSRVTTHFGPSSSHRFLVPVSLQGWTLAR